MPSPITVEDDEDEFAGIESMTASQWVRDPLIRRRVASRSQSLSRERSMSLESPKHRDCTLADLFPSSPVSIVPSTIPMGWTSSPVVPSKRGHATDILDPGYDYFKAAPKASKSKQGKCTAVGRTSSMGKTLSSRASTGKEKVEGEAHMEVEPNADEDWCGALEGDDIEPLDHPPARPPLRVPPVLRAIEGHIPPSKPPPTASKLDHPIALISDLDAKAQDFYRHHYRRGADRAKDTDNGEGAGRVPVKTKSAPKRFKKGSRKTFRTGYTGGRYKRK
ncbi:hypothetical protein L198_04129 [Cryptococcus wingfieldii CBS 7118]|uniref:Uncharacterized protein n=1 Tax=Cryptococcus wingfieldii CBS 7118 TaxID=1295528 RepID=A0A1E3J6V6_9TREE|nr:hypothetical protein L198_04129 [Cryptococcus wingfieldii CBS 7118]ODN96415.1 hypothetical protein L198_04129 [Cryptococcus wingfieldii CBS 7118]